MFKSFWQKVRIIARDSKIRNRILFVLGVILVFRLMAGVPIPGVDQFRLAEFLGNNQFLGLLNLFSGGGLSSLSIVMLGVGPYITSSIIMQLLTLMSPKLKDLYHEQGSVGRQKFMQYSRYLTLPLAVIQAFAFILILQNQGILVSLSSLDLVANIVAIVAGSMLLVWLGELISEFGIGNGVSIIIFSGIIAGLPSSLQTLLVNYNAGDIPLYAGLVLVALIIIFAVVLITEAERPIPVTYAKQVRGDQTYGGTSTYIPLRLNQAGVIPIIFALSIMLIPQMAFNLLNNAQNVILVTLHGWFQIFLSNIWVYGITYFLLVFLFTYFYTAVTFDPEALAKNLQKGGAFIPGVRPGEATQKHIGAVVTRLTLVGATFLGIIAILPLTIQNASGIAALSIGGTALLIVVSVIIDLIKKIDSQISMREY